LPDEPLHIDFTGGARRLPEAPRPAAVGAHQEVLTLTNDHFQASI
jgi:hypothetical protein